MTFLAPVTFQGTWILLLAIFGLTTAAAIAMTYQLLRQNGRLAQRIEALEARLGPDVVKQPGLDIDAEAPDFALPNLAGGRVSFDELRRSHPDLLLFFSEPGCGACDAMLVDVARWQRDHRDRLHIVPISRGGVEANRDKMNAAGLTGVLLQEDREVAQAYLVDATPSAVLVTGGRIASHVVAGDEAIRSLVADATRPKPYAKGDLVLPLQLADLEGRPVDLAQLGGRKTLLLFWNPTCGFCSGSLDDVKWWERHRDPALADLIVISKGDEASNRAQGFTSHVCSIRTSPRVTALARAAPHRPSSWTSTGVWDRPSLSALRKFSRSPVPPHRRVRQVPEVAVLGGCPCAAASGRPCDANRQLLWRVAICDESRILRNPPLKSYSSST